MQASGMFEQTIVSTISIASAVMHRIRLSGHGALAQLGERVLCKHEVVGSIPTGSTTLRPSGYAWRGHASGDAGTIYAGAEGRSVVLGEATWRRRAAIEMALTRHNIRPRNIALQPYPDGYALRVF